MKSFQKIEYFTALSSVHLDQYSWGSTSLSIPTNINIPDIQYINNQMRTQRDERKIKTIDINQFLDTQHNYRTLNYQAQPSPSSRIAARLKSHLNIRPETCISIQTYNQRYRKSKAGEEQHQQTKQDRYQQSQIQYKIDDFIGALHKLSLKEEGKDFIKSLNGTWFHETNEHFKCSKIYNSLGIKKNRSIKLRGQRGIQSPTKDLLDAQVRDKIDFTKQFKQAGIFPLRKRNLHSRTGPQSPKANLNRTNSKGKVRFQGQLKLQIIKNLKNESELRPVSRMSAVATSIRCLKSSRQTNPVTHLFSNESLSNYESQPVVKGKKMKLYD